MKLLIILFFIASLFLVDIGSVMYGRFISVREAPYFISMWPEHTKEAENHCGGSIISEYCVLTAAHCVSGHFTRIVAGANLFNHKKRSTIYRIKKIFVHGSYPDVPLVYDIALIQLKEPIQFDEHRQPIKLRKSPPRENETVIVMGFGDQGDAKDSPTVLRQSEVIVTSQRTCEIYAIESINTIFCAGNGTTDVCPGDSGGPAIIDGQLAGLVSFGPDCTTYDNHEQKPGAYTRLDIFHDWISKITGIMF